MINLKRRTFCQSSNNGVRALVSEDDLHAWVKITNTAKILNPNGLSNFRQELERSLNFRPRVFTFVNHNRFHKEDSRGETWHTGTFEDLEMLLTHIREMGGCVANNGIHIPFSNGYEYEQGTLGESERSWMLLPRDEREAFGVTLRQLREAVRR